MSHAGMADDPVGVSDSGTGFRGTGLPSLANTEEISADGNSASRGSARTNMGSRKALLVRAVCGCREARELRLHGFRSDFTQSRFGQIFNATHVDTLGCQVVLTCSVLLRWYLDLTLMENRYPNSSARK